MFGCNQVDIVNSANLLQFQEPARQFIDLLCPMSAKCSMYGKSMRPYQIETFFGMANVIILAKSAAQIAHGKENAPRTIVSLDARFFAKMRRDHIDNDIGADETHARLFIAVDATKPGTEIAVPQVSVCFGSLLCCVDGRHGQVPGHIIIHEKRRRKVKTSALSWCE